MAKQKEKRTLTETEVRDAQPDPARDVLLWHKDEKGFFMRIRPNGTKTFGVQLQVNGKQQRFTLGPASAKTLDAVRMMAAEKKLAAYNGANPVAERKAEMLAGDRIVERALALYEADMKARNCAKHHVSNTASVLRRGLESVKNEKVGDLSRQRLVALIAKIPTAGARQAFRGRLTPFLNYCANTGLCDVNRLAGWRVARTSRADMVAKLGRALTPEELKAVWNACGSAGTFGRAVQVMILTGLRRGEALALERGWVDADKNAIVIPGQRMKNGKPHAVPLTPALKAVLEACPQWAASPLFFPARAKGKTGGVTTIQGVSKLLPKLLKASGTADWSCHDIRRTFRSALTEMGVDHDLAERMIAHSRDKLTETYDRSSRWPERVAAVEAYERRIMQIVNGSDAGNVIPLHMKAADTAA